MNGALHVATQIRLIAQTERGDEHLGLALDREGQRLRRSGRCITLRIVPSPRRRDGRGASGTARIRSDLRQRYGLRDRAGGTPESL